MNYHLDSSDWKVLHLLCSEKAFVPRVLAWFIRVRADKTSLKSREREGIKQEWRTLRTVCALCRRWWSGNLLYLSSRSGRSRKNASVRLTGALGEKTGPLSSGAWCRTSTKKVRTGCKTLCLNSQAERLRNVFKQKPFKSIMYMLDLTKLVPKDALNVFKL